MSGFSKRVIIIHKVLDQKTKSSLFPIQKIQTFATDTKL